MLLNRVSIRNTLTIRYDITKKSNTKPVTVQDFKESFSDPNGYATEKLLNNSFKKIKKFNNFSISLSGGIDSSLCLALLRNNYPKAKITAISGVFENAYDESTHAKKLAEKFDADFIRLIWNRFTLKCRKLSTLQRDPDGILIIT